MLGFKFCTCWSLMEVTTHDRAKETKIGNLVGVPNEIGGKESWTTGGDSTNGAVPNVREIGLLILITIYCS